MQISLDSKRGCGFTVDKRPPVGYYDPATKKRQRKFLGKGHIPADGVTRSGVWLQTRTKMAVALENPVKSGTEGAKRAVAESLR